MGKDEQHMLTGVAAETSAEDVSDLYVMVMGSHVGNYTRRPIWPGNFFISSATL